MKNSFFQDARKFFPLGRWRSFAAFSFAFFTNMAWAQELPTDWRGVRAAGMGFAFTAVSNDESAAFYNPAGLARSRNPRAKSRVHFFGFPEVSAGGNSPSVRSVKGNEGSAESRYQRIIADAKKHPGQPFFVEAQAFPSIIFGGKSAPTYLIGTAFRSTNKVQFDDVDNPDHVQLASQSTGHLVLSISDSTRAGTFSWGVTVRPNYRFSFRDEAYNTADSTLAGLRDQIKETANRTTAVGADAGILFTAADFWFPTLGLAIRNIPTGCVENYPNPLSRVGSETMCGSKRSGDVQNTDPSELIDPTEVRVGFAITPRVRTGGSRINLRLSVDVFPIPITTGGKSYGLSDVRLTKLVHGGAELWFGHALRAPGFALRAGFSQGFPSYGASLAFLGIAIDYASYSEDVGTQQTQQGDRRHLIGLSTHW